MGATSQDLLDCLEDDVETIRVLAELGPLFDEAGPDYHRHMIVVLCTIARLAQRMQTTTACLSAHLNAAR